MRLKSLEALRSGRRDPAIDLFRGLAIIGVVFYHGGLLLHGDLGVDLFFVISGFLVGGILIEEHLKGPDVSVPRFLLSRGFKIWPSYFAFLAAGTALAWLTLRQSMPEELIPLREWPRYLLFYRNYRGGLHWSFDHIWSLCVEEHFYILLPTALAVAAWAGALTRKRLAWVFILFVALGVCGKWLSYRLHFDGVTATHNRLDELAWGALLYLLLKRPGGHKLAWPARAALFAACGAGLVALIAIGASGTYPVFNAIGYYAVMPLAFVGMLLSLQGLPLPFTFPIRLAAYYSYNWYLWHPIFATLFLGPKGQPDAPFDGPRFALYLAFSLGTAVLFTVLVEEPFLERRRAVIEKIFRKDP